MKNTIKEKVENIMDLVTWFEEYQPEDLEQIERILLGLQYVNKDIVENDFKRYIYRHTKLIKEEKYIQTLFGLSNAYLRMDLNNRLIKE